MSLILRPNAPGSRFSPYAQAWRYGRAAANAYKQYSASSGTGASSGPVGGGTPIKVTRKAGAVGKKRYRKAGKPVIRSKKARKAIAQVVHDVMNREVELKKTDPVVFNLPSMNHRMFYASDLTGQLSHGTGPDNYEGRSVHFTSIQVRGYVNEYLDAGGKQITPTPTKLEFYVIQTRGKLGGIAVTATGSGMYINPFESNLVKSLTDSDNTIEGTFAKMAPKQNDYRIISKKIINVTQNRLSNLNAIPGYHPFNFNMKVDKVIEPGSQMSTGEEAEKPHVYFVVRGMGPIRWFAGATGTYTTGTINFDTVVRYRDA